MKKSENNRINPRFDAFKIAVIYVIVSIIWIISSDQILAISISNPQLSLWIASAKGILFVTLTTILIYILVYHNLSSIKESEERFFKAFNSNPISIVLTKIDGEIIDVNDSYLSMTGFKKSEVLGKNAIDLNITTSETRQKVMMEYKKQGFIKDFESEINVKSGEKRIVLTTIESITLEGKKHNLNFLYDITERENVKTMLVESEEKYREIFNKANDMISLNKINEDQSAGNFIEINDVGVKRLGYSRDEILNMNPLEIIPLDSQDIMFKYVSQLEKTRHAKFDIAYITKNGKKIPTEVSIHIFKLRGYPVALTVSRDITDRKKAEIQMKKSLNEKETLLREIHHRVNNNLQVISSLLNLQAYSEEKKSRDTLLVTQSRIKSMAMIHEKLYKSPDLTHINMKKYIETFISDLFYLYQTDRDIIQLNMDIEDIEMGIETAIPLGLIINEVIVNTLKHAFPDEISGNIEISFKSQGEYFLLTMEDDGIGLPDNITLQSAQTLGLQLVNNLITQLDADLEIIRSKGTKFKITFKELKYNKRI
ncbi:PAS domain S-box protein [Methanobacterium alcaliphilum]|nr:PAS domain S-box protein [Methanobacterium alcaliphilum]